MTISLVKNKIKLNLSYSHGNSKNSLLVIPYKSYHLHPFAYSFSLTLLLYTLAFPFVSKQLLLDFQSLFSNAFVIFTPSGLFSCEDIKIVQSLIEPCLPQYMKRQEVMEKLLVEVKISPGLIELAWKKLEEQRQEFFKTHHLMVSLKQQTTKFNQLLEKQH